MAARGTPPRREGLVSNWPSLGQALQALLPAAQQVVQGKITGEEAGALAAKVAKEWRDFNPDMVDHYKKWAADLS